MQASRYPLQYADKTLPRAGATPGFRMPGGPENISWVAPARVGAMNGTVCFVVRLVVGPLTIYCYISHSTPRMAWTSKFFVGA